MADDAGIINQVLTETSFLYGANAAFVEDLYAQWSANPSSVEPSWQAFFAALPDQNDAIKAAAAKPAWTVRNKSPFWAGVLSTASGVVFTGSQTGQFLAFDSKSGKKLWSFQTGSGISGLPIAWEKNGREYITVLSGAAQVYGALAGDPDLANVPAGGSVWTFALPPGK